MSDEVIGLLLLISLLAIFAALIYIIIALSSSKTKVRKGIKSMYHAEDSGKDLIFKYRNYDIIATFRSKVKISIIHGRDVEGIKAPTGAELTPMYLIFKVKKPEEVPTKLDKYIDFLETIPTQ